jgi:hypothetical protein
MKKQMQKPTRIEKISKQKPETRAEKRTKQTKNPK